MRFNFKSEKGFTLIAAIMLTIVMGLILASYNMVSIIDLKSTKTSIDHHSAAYSAEAGLNIRAEEFRGKLALGEELTGTRPADTDPCEGSNQGSGDFVCKDYVLGKKTVTTYVTQETAGAESKAIPPGEPFNGLQTNETTYTIHAFAKNFSGSSVGAILESKMRARQVPIFQFAAFYDKDLEIERNSDMALSGPIHTNKDLYLSSAGDLLLNGQITIAGDFYKGSKYSENCDSNGSVHINKNAQLTLPDPIDVDDYRTTSEFLDNFITMKNTSGYACSGSGITSLSSQDFSEWDGNVQQHISPVVPPPLTYNAVGAGNLFWDIADVRIVLKLDVAGIPQGFEVQNVNGDDIPAETNNIINNCGSVVSSTYQIDPTDPEASGSNHFWDQMRQTAIVMLEVEVEDLISCLDSQGIVSYDDNTEDGHIIFFSFEVDGLVPSCNTKPCYNNYGVRYKNGADLIGIDPNLNGLTMVTDQPVYLTGNFNLENGSGDKLPTSLYGDSLFILSENWMTADHDAKTRTQQDIFDSNFDDDNNFIGVSYDVLRTAMITQMENRIPEDTTYNAALVFGTTTNGGLEGPAGRGANPKNGGMNNYARMFENWGAINPITSNKYKTTLKGSFVSLDQQWRVQSLDASGANVGLLSGYHYTVPLRDYSFDNMFNDSDNQPPGALSFVYLKQEFFSRSF